MSVVAGDLGIAMPTGRVLADDGALYESVQAAENAASSFIWIGPGTFAEAVTVDTAGLMVLGSGRGTLIDGGTDGDAISIEAANVLVANLSVQTTAGQGNTFNGIHTGVGGDSGIIYNVWVRDSDNSGVGIDNGSDWVISNVVVETSEETGFIGSANRLTVVGCIVQDTSGAGNGVFAGGNNWVISSCITRNTVGRGIRTGGSASNSIIIGNRVINSGREGIQVNGSSEIIANNRVSGSTDADISDAGTNTVLDDNRTGSAN